MMKKIFLLLTIFIIGSKLCYSADSLSYFSWNNSFTNKLNYAGRLAEPTQSALTTSLNYFTNAGFEYSLTQYYWSKTNNKLAETDAGVAYKHNLNDVYSLSAGYEHWFITKGNGENTNTLNNAFTASMDADYDWIELNIAPCLLIGKTKAFYVGADVSHSFYVDKLLCFDSIDITPTITFDWGSSTTTLQHNPKQADASSTALPKAGRKNQKTATSFMMLNYDFYLPITFYIRHFEIEPAFHYDIPVNGTATQPVSSFYYFTLAVNYKLPIKHH